ncbi:CG4982 [Drosophila busckii]|uniref:CG4982 n=1 Tax=Drosophila busckii TaxID=30019 RepID=A0A0M3QWD4_DROBS|nr:uncharacterized protein LOC108599712 [Drosophila busckii]ALC43949.1 CG4982 [Drosophila busckii]
MWKILTLLLALGLAAARPSYLPSYESIEYTPHVLGYESYALPAAVSHQSSTVVHEKRPYWRPVLSPLHTHSLSYPLSYDSSWLAPGWSTGLSYAPSAYLK